MDLYMQLYSPKIRVTCPKCGWGEVPSVIYEPTSHPGCRLTGEHLHGWCSNCNYDGLEYIFTVKHKKEAT